MANKHEPYNNIIYCDDDYDNDDENNDDDDFLRRSGALAPEVDGYR